VSEDRASREAAGRRAERFAALWLRLKGYGILANRFRAPGGEIDLVAAWPLLGPVRSVVFVEVKHRDDEADFAEAIAPRQRRRIEAGADAFLGANPQLAGKPCRFDAVYVAPGHLPRHVANLWRRGE